MNKRRRTSSDLETDDSEESEEQFPTVPIVGRKRKKLDPMELCQQLYDSIRNYKKEDGTMLCDTFVRAPKRRQEPSYYDIVSSPMDLIRVQQKLKTDAYEDIDDLTSDIELLVNNAKSFYKPDSAEYEDACTLLEIFKAKKAKLIESQNEDTSTGFVDAKARPSRSIGRPRKSTTIDDDQTSEHSSENDYDHYEELFAAVMTAVDPVDDRSLHTMFQLLPSKKHYPEYYAVIDHPIDLKFIANKIQTNAYTNLTDMEKDLLQMVKNAQIFNEPGSQIYKDAKTLKRIFLQRKLEIESGRYKRPSRGRGRPISYSAICAALKEELVSSEEEDMDDIDDVTQTGPLWQLFDYLYNQSSSGGTPLGESLWKLPNRRFHPDYFSLIKKPISMSMIQKKLKKGEYANVTEMSADLYQMLDNAKKANLPSSKTYKDAVKMGKILNEKLVDDGLDDDDTEDTDSSNMYASPTVAGGTEKKKKGRPRIHPVSSASPAPIPVSTTPITKYLRFPNNPALKKKLLMIHKYLLDYTFDDRQPMEPFLEKPSKKLYPDYYQIIQHPIDMNTIQKNIENDRYATVDDVVGDYRLMFSNCRKYNEENSMIYDDSNLLEKVLNDRLKELSGVTDRRPKLIKAQNKKAQAILDAKLKQLYETIRDYKDLKIGRQVSLIFMKLPSKMDYPDYYEIISKPIDLAQIGLKLKSQQYDSIDELAADLMLMFENACKYNEPDSQIYKDALVLQQVCIQTKLTLKIEDENVPDVPQVVVDFLMQLFTTVYNYTDEEGRCYSDSMAELPEFDEVDGFKQKAISLDLIKRRLDKGIYKRLDTFQEDVFSCFDRARRLSRTDSQVFEDSIEMQSFFIRTRDELCKNGEVLSSPALSFSMMHLNNAVEGVRQTKLLQEEEPEPEAETNVVAPSQSESMSIDNGKVFTPGDFVYYQLSDDKTPGILYIERLYTNSDGEKLCEGNVYLRPYQTYHLTTRKFLEQEVFKSDQHQTVPLKDLQQKCYVMSVKDYFKLNPESFSDKDVYVCEFRYNCRARSFKKIKAWPFQTNGTKLMLREIPLEPKRVQSVFKDRPIDAVKVEVNIDEVDLALAEKEKPNVMVQVEGSDESNTYFEQFNTICSGVVKTGDFVYVATESGKQAIAQIHSIWETKDGKSFFRGPWLLASSELPASLLIGRMQYRQEVFLSTVQELTPTVGILGRCCVMEYYDYTTRRPTEIPESDVYLCESIYDEFKKQIRKFSSPVGLKKFTHSTGVTADEIYFFRRPINVQKVMADSQDVKSEIDQLKLEAVGGTNSCDVLGMTEDSMDTPSVGSADFASTSSPVPSSSTMGLSTPATSKRPAAFTGGKSGKKVITGYILYSSEVRKSKVMENPECKFGDISRMIGDEWRALNSNERRQWEDRASTINEQNATKYAEDMALNGNAGKDSPQMTTSSSSVIVTPNQLSMQHEFVQNQAFECGWDKCDYQFEDPGDALEHAVAEGVGCVQRYFSNLSAQNEPIVYHCLWRNCIRAKRNQPPLPNIQRLVKHVREVHVVKAPGKIVLPQDRGKNYVASTRKHLHQNQNSGLQTQQIIYHQPVQPVITTPISTGSPQMCYAVNQQTPQQQNVINYVQPPVEPLFVTVPPRPQRVLHSDAYIKYIEGLQNNSPYIGQWEKTMKATRTTLGSDPSRLPTQWLGEKSKNKPEEVLDALWDLRNYMLRDTLTLSRNQY